MLIDVTVLKKAAQKVVDPTVDSAQRQLCVKHLRMVFSLIFLFG